VQSSPSHLSSTGGIGGKLGIGGMPELTAVDGVSGVGSSIVFSSEHPASMNKTISEIVIIASVFFIE
jgi:hypothetical protein